MKTPQYLKKGSKIALVAPARKISRDEVTAAVSWIRKNGFVPVYDDRLFAEYHQLAGDDDFRASVLQHYLDRDDIDAILCVRGGYGTIRIIDKLDFTGFEKHPKWIVGYSDVTVLHAKMQQLGYQSIHGTMAINFEKNTKEALETLYEALTNPSFRPASNMKSTALLKISPLPTVGRNDKQDDVGRNDKQDDVGRDDKQDNVGRDDIVVGGNLSVLYSMLGSDLFPETDGKVLFIEDLDEYLYHIDRMMTALKRAGKLARLKALMVGAFSDMHDNTIPFGMTAKEIIFEKVKEYGYPVIWDYPAGHIDDNRAIIFG